MTTTIDADPMTASVFLFHSVKTPAKPWPRPSTTTACSAPGTS